MKGEDPIVISGPLAALYGGTVLFVAEALARAQVVSSFPIALVEAAAAAVLAGAIVFSVQWRRP